MIKLRASGMPLLFACASSGDDDLLIDHANEMSGLGSACHQGLELVVAGEHPDLDPIALRWSADREELGRLVWYGQQVWRDIGPSFQQPLTEVSVFFRAPDFELSGHIDVLSRYPRRAFILDWKSGFLDKNFYHQLAAYAACLIFGEGYDEVVAMVGWLRDEEKETYTFTRHIVTAWLERLRDQLKRRGRYTVGSHCATCPRNHSCPAAIAESRKAVQIFSAADMAPEQIAQTLDALPEPERVQLYRRLRAVLKMGEDARAAFRLNVVQSGGTIDGGDGTVLQVKEETSRRRLDTARMQPILQEHLNPDEIHSVTDVSLSRLETLVAKRAGKGKGAGAKRALLDQIKAADALFVSTALKMVERRKDTSE